MNTRTLVIGDGGWGTALAMALYRAGRPVTLWSVDESYAKQVASTRENTKFLSGVVIPDEILWTGDRDLALQDVDEYYSVVPTQFLRSTIESFDGRLAHIPAVSATKGLELETLRRPTEILKEAAGAQAGLTILSGPSHAEETALGLATSIVAASDDPHQAKRVQERLGSEHMRVYTANDPTGVELGGALKNIIAVAAGLADGIGLGDNAKAALVSRGLVEMGRFGESCGAKRETFFGLSGSGDLMVTCYSRHSRNRALGERIGKGESLQSILETTEKVSEGVWTCRAIHEAAQSKGVEMPITEQLYSVLFDGLNPRDAVRDLMLRPVRSEHDLPA